MATYYQKYPLDFGKVSEDFDTAVRAVIHKVERECPAAFAQITAAREYLLISLLRAQNTYRTIRYICADTPPDPARRPIYMLSIPILSRAILDTTFNLLYLFENPARRFPWFNKAGWIEQAGAYEQLVETYGHYSDWQSYLTKFKGSLDRLEKIVEITPDEKNRTRRIDKWPTPGQMPTFRVKAGQQSPNLRFLQYLNDWFYRELSQDVHLSAFSASRFGAILLNSLDPITVDLNLDWDLVRGVLVGRTLALVLSLFSEVDAYFQFGRKEQLKYLWCFLGEHGPETKELYEERYRDLLEY